MYLLDTHTLLWYFEGDSSLSAKAKKAIDSKNSVTISILSFWEITIKQSLGKLTCKYTIDELSLICAEAKIPILPITIAHLEKLAELPFIHRDPFDRLLVAQAMTEALSIITMDTVIPLYPVKTLW